jgi:hypothetical protein
MDWGDEPTANVAPAIPLAADLVMKLISQWDMQK